MDFVTLMPKVDLHCHLDGGLRPETVLDIAKSEDIPLPARDREGILPYLQAGDRCSDLKEYLCRFELPVRCLQSREAQRRAAFEVVEDAVKNNVKYLEVRFAPELFTRRGLSTVDVTRNVLEGLKKGESETGTVARAILVCMRHHTEQQNDRVIDAAARFLGKGVVGVDLAGDEAGFPPQLFHKVFARARQFDIPVTIHAGEAGGAENVLEAIKNLGALRIGHGIHIQENRSILEYVARKEIPLELCLTSNVQTRAAASLESHPVRTFFDEGLKVTINTDNPTVSRTDMTREFRLLHECFHFTRQEMHQVVINSVRAAFLENRQKAALLKNMEDAFRWIN
jgi:adenosine deaminase